MNNEPRSLIEESTATHARALLDDMGSHARALRALFRASQDCPLFESLYSALHEDQQEAAADLQALLGLGGRQADAVAHLLHQADALLALAKGSAANAAQTVQRRAANAGAPVHQFRGALDFIGRHSRALRALFRAYQDHPLFESAFPQDMEETRTAASDLQALIGLGEQQSVALAGLLEQADTALVQRSRPAALGAATDGGQPENVQPLYVHAAP